MIKKTENKRKSKLHIKKVAVILIAILLLPYGEVCAEGITADEETLQAKRENLQSEAETVQENNAAIEELNKLIDEQWEEDYFAEMIVETGSAQIEVDGDTTDFREEFDLSVGEARQIVDSQKSIEDYFEKDADGCYETERIGSEKVRVTAPFQTRRLIVTGVCLRNTYGASETITFSKYDTIILQYDTEEQAIEAYDKIRATYGDDACQPDRVYSSDQLLMENTESEYYECVSWGAKRMGLENLKNQTGDKISLAADKVTVAVIDTGINSDSYFFEGRTITDTSRNFQVSSEENQEVVKQDEDISDQAESTKGHGTHVAGIIADATPDNVQLMILKVFNDEGRAPYIAIYAALVYAIEQRADVINMSLGFSGVDESLRSQFASMDAVIDQAVSDGIPICVAAGNEGDDLATCYPACNEQVFAVGSVRSVNDELIRSTSSNYGDELDFCAPGVSIDSASYQDNEGTATKSGTSMATPHLSAAVAYVKLLYPDMSVSRMEDFIKSYCNDLGEEGWDQYYGWGLPYLAELYQKENDSTESPDSNDSSESSKSDVSPGSDASSGSVVSSGSATSPISSVSPAPVSTEQSKTVSNPSATAGNVVRKLSKVKSFKVKQTKSRRIVVQWKKSNGVSGYQIQFAKKKNFAGKKNIFIKKAGKTRYVLKKQKKGRTYYFRIRAYKIVNGKKVYSSWSAKKKIKIK